MEDDSLHIYLTIDGTSIKHEEVVITNPSQLLSGLVNRIINAFKLPMVSDEGVPIRYLLGHLLEENELPEILEFKDECEREQCLLDYNIQSGDQLYLIPLPIPGYIPNKNKSESPNKENDDFFIYLTIEGTPIENVKMEVADPMKTIREQINSIEEIFHLSKMDRGYPFIYSLGLVEDDIDSPHILEFDDADGREQTLIDYNVQPGDHLSLISIPVAGGCPFTFFPSPKEKRNIWQSLIEGIRKEQVVYSSVFAPMNVKPYSHMIVQVYLHLFEETEKVMVLAQESQLNAERRDYIPLQCKLKKGDKVDIILNIYGKTLLMSDKKSVIWQGSFTKCSFDYYVPSNIGTSTLSCCALLSVNEAWVGEMRFITNISMYTMKLNPEIYARQYNKIFISYAHQDEVKVEPMARAYQAQGVDYFFDRHYLKPGDIFPLKIQEFIDTADLFILCWSANAAKSDYVEMERKHALKRAFPQVQPIEKAELSIYPMSIEPRAELPADMKDIYNFEVN